MPDQDAIIDTVHRYLALAATGTGAEIARLYTPDALVEDPVGAPPHIGADAIADFYDSVRGERAIELLALRRADNMAAFHFRVTTLTDSATIIVEPIDVMTFDEQGLITSMRAIWTSTDLQILPNRE